MPREQAKIRALHRLTNQICDILYHQEFLNAVINMRKRLKIDIEGLKGTDDDRPQALAQFLLDRRLISKLSARGLTNRYIIQDSGRFWKVASAAYYIDWPDDYYYVPNPTNNWVEKRRKTDFARTAYYNIGGVTRTVCSDNTYVFAFRTNGTIYKLNQSDMSATGTTLTGRSISDMVCDDDYIYATRYAVSGNMLEKYTKK